MCRTGYATIRESNEELFDENVLSRLGPVSGLDAEGEVNGSYRPCGHPGVCLLTRPHDNSSLTLLPHQLWFATGDFLLSRFLSKSLVTCTLCVAHALSLTY